MQLFLYVYKIGLCFLQRGFFLSALVNPMHLNATHISYMLHKYTKLCRYIVHFTREYVLWFSQLS